MLKVVKVAVVGQLEGCLRLSGAEREQTRAAAAQLRSVSLPAYYETMEAAARRILDAAGAYEAEQQRLQQRLQGPAPERV